MLDWEWGYSGSIQCDSNAKDLDPRKGKNAFCVILKSGLFSVQFVFSLGKVFPVQGFVPAFARMGPWNVVFFLVYERLRLIDT